MNEWLKQNTTIDEKEYDSIINSDTINIKGSLEKNDGEMVDTIFDHPMISIKGFAFKKPNIFSKWFFEVKGNRKIYIHNNIKFRILAEYIKNINSEFIDIKALTKFLYSKDKLGQCFQLSVHLSLLFDNSKVILAMCQNYVFKQKIEFLHAFVVFEKEGIEYVVDGAFNILMEKNTYFDLMKPNIINEIPGKRAFKEAYYIHNSAVSEQVMYVDYLCYPNEILQGVKNYTKTHQKTT